MTRFALWFGASGLAAALLLPTGPAFAQIGARTQTADSAAAADSASADTTTLTSAQAAGAGVAAAGVLLGGDTVLIVRSRIGSFTTAERAAAIQARLGRLARDPSVEADSVRTVAAGGSIDIVLGDLVLMSVTPADAAAAGLALPELAAMNAEALREALRRQGFFAIVRIIALGVLFTLITAFATYLIFRLVQRLFGRVIAAVDAGRDSWIPALRFQKLELLSANNFADVMRGLLRLLRLALLALLLYIAIPTILSFFPWTEQYADRLFGYVLSPFAGVFAAFVDYLPDLFKVGAIAVVTWYLLKLIRLVFIGIAREKISFAGFYPDWAMPTYKLVRMLVLLFAFIMAWPYLPASESPAFRGVGVLFGLLVTFGSASAIGNIVGGVVLTYMRPFKVGDRVKISDTIGDVIEKTLLVTRIRTIKHVEITIPNSMVLGAHIINYSAAAAEGGVILATTVTIGYDAPWRRVHELLIAAAAATADIKAEPTPFVLQTALDDFYVRYELNAYTERPGRMARIYSDLHAAIQDRFNEAGIEIMSPHYRADRDGNTAAIPAEYLPPDYKAPSFRVARTGETPMVPAGGAAGDGGRTTEPLSGV